MSLQQKSSKSKLSLTGTAIDLLLESNCRLLSNRTSFVCVLTSGNTTREWYLPNTERLFVLIEVKLLTCSHIDIWRNSLFLFQITKYHHLSCFVCAASFLGSTFHSDSRQFFSFLFYNLFYFKEKC